MHRAVWKLNTSNGGTLIYWNSSGHLSAVHCQFRGLKEVSLHLENLGESASMLASASVQYARVPYATDGKVGVPGAAR